MSSRRFRIAFSFAGEKRDFVQKVARILAERFGEMAILYDKFHEAEFANADLAFDLPSLYKTHADLIVAVFCPNYEHKEWCGLEWRAIFSIIKEGGAKQVLLTRYDHTDGKGLHGLGGFIELDHKTPEQAVALILERLALNEGRPKEYYFKPVAPHPSVLKTSIPHNLPTLQPFFGREDELKKIADALDPENRGWGALIDGPGGMGKTSLAVRAAYDASPEDFKKIAFISLKTRELDDDGLRDLSGFILTGLAELLNELAREIGHADIAKAPEDQRPRLLLDALRGTQTLLVLDNLESLTKPDRDRLFTLVKKLPQGCKAILTARGRIGSGAEELILEKLSQDAALATLAELATHNPHLAKTSEAERITLYTQTAGKPLLLRWTAGQLGRGHCLTFTDALHFLRSCQDDDPLEFIFGELVEDFSAMETRTLSALTYFSLPAKVEHIRVLTNPVSAVEQSRAALAAVLGGSLTLPNDFIPEKEEPGLHTEAEVEIALKSLANRSLVVPNDESKAFSLVPLVADFLRKKKPEVIAETGDRLEKRAYALVVENGFGQHERFPVIEAAWPSVVAALPHFLTGPNRQLQTMCNALRVFLEFSGRLDESLSINVQAEIRAVAEKDFVNAGQRAHDAGRINDSRGQSAEVLACANRAEKHWRAADVKPEKIADAIHLRGHGHRLAGDQPAAIAAFRQALELSRNGGDIATELCCLAASELEIDQIDSARQHYEEALRSATHHRNTPMQAAIKGAMARLALRQKDWTNAESLAREALAEMEKINYLDFIAESCRDLAEALTRQGRKPEALPYARRALDIHTQLGSRSVEVARATLRECEN